MDSSGFEFRLRAFAGASLVLLILTGCANDSSENSDRDSTAPSSTPSQKTRSTSAPNTSPLASSGFRGSSAKSKGRRSHRSREAQERRNRVVEHPAAHQSVPDDFRPVRPAATSISDPAGGQSAAHPDGSDVQTKLNQLGFAQLQISVYSKGLGSVIQHYVSQGEGKGKLRQDGSKATITYRVEEGNLLIGLSERDGKTYVTRALVRDRSTTTEIPDWLKNLPTE